MFDALERRLRRVESNFDKMSTAKWVTWSCTEENNGLGILLLQRSPLAIATAVTGESKDRGRGRE